MTLNRKTLMILAGVTILLSLAACTREITTVQEVNPGASNCFECHTDQDMFIAGPQMEWAYSDHGIGAYVGYAGNREGCAQCHSGSGFVAYLNGEEGTPYGTSIGCFACHAPHSNGDFMLRITEPQKLLNDYSMDLGASNLCVPCHQSRQSVYDYVVAVDGVVTIGNHWGPHHSPQADMLMGSNGFEFAGHDYDNAAPAAHVSVENDACLACHFNANSVNLGGHSFDMRTDGDDLNVASCNRCHTDATDFDINDAITDLTELAEELHAHLQTEGLLDEDGHSVTGATTTVPKAGALWNYLLWEEDQSHGIHNPYYFEDLLQSSIEQF